MSTYDAADIVRLHEAGKSQVAIAEELGISRPTVNGVLRKAGRTQPRSEDDFTTRYIPDDVEILPKHRKQHAYRMLRALEKDADGKPFGESTRERLKTFIPELDAKTWSYNQEAGLYSVPRKAKHKKRPFVREQDLLQMIYN